LLANAPTKSFARDQLVFDQNVPNRAIFFIEEGLLRVERQDRGATIPIAILGAGEFFGEMSFVDGAPTSAQVIAEEPSRLRIIGVATIEELAKTDPSFAARFYHSIAAILSQRLRQTSMRMYLDQSWG
jgi:CRP/FNR family cyclic AMP-dependent transcriptional regulator